MTYEQAVSYVNSFSKFGIKPGLDRIKLLLKMLGNPQKNLRFIHVAGTNGKGSTCMFISSILKASGLKTGLFTSPFTIDFRERFKIDDTMISQKDFVDILNCIIPSVKKMAENGIKLTEFELITSIGFFWFNQKNCDIVVLETGLGGRLDATNVIDNTLISVITSISYDHMNILGNSIESIANEKAGILKQNGTLVLYPKQKRKSFLAIKNVASNLNNKIIMPNLKYLTDVKFDYLKTQFTYMNEHFEINLLGQHQIYNAITAITTVNELIHTGFKISNENIKFGLINTKFPSRFEIISKNPLVIIDGTHNLDGAIALRNTINLYFKQKRIIAIFGMLKDKEIDKILNVVAPFISEFIIVQPKNPRALDKFDLNNLVKNFNENCTVANNLAHAVTLAFSKLNTNSAILVWGSLYLASQVRPLLMSYCENF